MKTLKLTLLPILLLLFTLNSGFAQKTTSEKGYKSLGVGFGLPYGGIGGRFGINVVNQLNLFGGLGYNFESLGYNFGALYSIPSESRTEFYFTAMYGANASINIEGASEYNGTFNGATAGIGIKIESKRNDRNYFDIGLLLPFRSSAYEDKIDAIKNDSRIEEFTEPWPVLIVVGFNFGI